MKQRSRRSDTPSLPGPRGLLSAHGVGLPTSASPRWGAASLLRSCLFCAASRWLFPHSEFAASDPVFRATGRPRWMRLGLLRTPFHNLPARLTGSTPSSVASSSQAGPQGAQLGGTCGPVTPGLGSCDSRAGMRPLGPDAGKAKAGLPHPLLPPRTPCPPLATESTRGSQVRAGQDSQPKVFPAVVPRVPISCRGSQGTLGPGVHTWGQGGSEGREERRSSTFSANMAKCPR